MDTIQPGLTGKQVTVVTEELTARHLGSGGIDVFATPAMLALMEAAAVAAIDHALPEGQVSVGTAAAIEHLAATPMGQRVEARAEVTLVEGRRIVFSVEAHDEQELIGRGTHTRFIIDTARFSERLEQKRSRQEKT